MTNDRQEFDALFAEAESIIEDMDNSDLALASSTIRPPPLDAQQAQIRLIDLKGRWQQTPLPPQFVIDRYLPASVVTLLSGHGGAGKTSLALAMGACVAAGMPFADRDVKRGRVAFVSLEDSADLVHLRLTRIVEAYRLDPEAVLDQFTLLDGSHSDAVLARPVENVLRPTATLNALWQWVQGHTLIVIDNASDAYAGNENARVEVRGFMRLLASLARQTGAAVVLLAHLDKAAAKAGGQGNSYSGSTAWHNSSRSRLSLIADDGAIHLLHEKCNLAATADPLLIHFNNQGIPVPMLALSSREESFSDMLPAFEAAARIGSTIYDNLHPGSHCAFAVLEVFDEWPKRYHGKAGRKLAAKGINRLIAEGTLRREEYRKTDRKLGSRLVLAQPVPQERTQ